MRVLGISPFHDSSVALYKDGEIELFIKEERLTRIKRDMYPYKSIKQALEYCNYKVDEVVVAPPSVDSYNDFLLFYLDKTLDKRIKIMEDSHHLQHAALAFYNSGFDKSLIIVVDRNGSLTEEGKECESVFIAEYPAKFKKIYSNSWKENELGIVKVYEAATTLIGQHPLENGKTMGLSAYGKIADYPLLFDENLNANHSLFSHIQKDNFKSDTQAIYKDHIGSEVEKVLEGSHDFYANFAYEVQQQTQEQVLKLIKKSVEETKIKNVCITGGYGLNVVANGYYIDNTKDVNFYFEPLADDSGNSIGAAMYIYHLLTNDNKIKKLDHTFYHNVDPDLSIVSNGITEISHVVDKILDNKTVGIFKGKAESGPRALGNRSIVFDPRNPDAKKIVNLVKKREWYRPFAGVVLEEDFEKYFHTKGLKSSEYMTISFKVKEEFINLFPGIVHVDGTCRVQTVSQGHLYDLLKEFKKITGLGVLLNTSFNLAGDPLVETVADAINTLNNSFLDYVWFVDKNNIVT